MKIPTPALSFYLSENENRAFAETNKTTPVDGSAKLRSSLSDYLPERWWIFADNSGSTVESAEHAEAGQPRRGSQRQRDEQAGGTERRKEQRRKITLPVVLDTRLTRCRRAGTRFSAINFAI